MAFYPGFLKDSQVTKCVFQSILRHFQKSRLCLTGQNSIGGCVKLMKQISYLNDDQVEKRF